MNSNERNFRAIYVAEMQRAERIWVLDARSALNDKSDSCLFRNLLAFEDCVILRCMVQLESCDLDPEAKFSILILQGHILASLDQIK